MFAFIFLCILAANVYGQPADWVPKIASGDMVFTMLAPEAISKCYFPAIGNGFLATTAGPHVRDSPDYSACGWIYAAGIHNGPYNDSLSSDPSPSHRAALARVTDFTITRSTPSDSFTPLGVAMDYSSGIFFNRTLVNLPACASTQVEMRHYAHRGFRDLMVLEVVAGPAQNSTGEWAGCTLDVTWMLNISATAADVALVEQSGNGSGPTVWYGNTTVPELPGGTTQAVGLAFSPWISALAQNGNAAVMAFTPSRTTWTALVVVHSSLDAPALGKSPALASTDAYATYAAMSSQQLLQSHLAAMEADVWSSGIELEGNTTLASLVNSSLYHILATSYRGDWPISSGPGSLAGNGYGGHVFWDTETWQFPVIMPFSPSSAKATSEFRVSRVQAAIDRAVSSNYWGAEWPWQCSVSGVDNSRDPKDNLYEQHIGADIALAWKQLYYSTLDLNWLAGVYSSLSATCEFYACRFARSDSPQGSTQPYPQPELGLNCGDKTTGTGNYTIRGIVPPDEAAGVVDDNAYTNLAAAMALDWCVEAAGILRQTPQPMWATLAASPYVPLTSSLSADGPVHQEYTGYNGSRIIQQADVALMQYPLGQVYSPDLAKRDLDYWLSVTDMAGMFTGDTVYAVAYLALGDVETAAAQWGYAWDHTDLTFMIPRETAGGTGGTHHFITGAGSFLQVLLYGYSGMRIEKAGAMSFTHPMPALPPYGVRSMKLRGVHLGGSAFDFWYNATTICVNLNTAAAATGIGAGHRATAGQSGLELVTIGNGGAVVLTPTSQCLPVQPVEIRHTSSPAPRV